ncbi:MAG: type I-E CRISPR-associated protein Cas6/Cse3/CasE [Chloroflexi bacterium]|nr:type I-E CRISPR-associated protein Cas6/Cse3/CasE [Chloroflexota bacterium]
MYLSTLLINVGDNPDRPRPGRLWLRNLYHVHQRLCMAFPSASRKTADPDFLCPFKPDDFGPKPVHEQRSADGGFLFRVDPQPGGRAAILVQSGARPDLEYAFHNADYLLCASQVREYDPQFRTGEALRFRLLANPVRKVSAKSLDVEGKPFEEKWIGKDVPVPPTELPHWLERRAEPGWSAQKNARDEQTPPGFRLIKVLPPQAGYVYWSKSGKEGTGQRLRSVRYDGVLEVTNPDHFRKTLMHGIGPGKAFGFGLLSIASLPQEARA